MASLFGLGALALGVRFGLYMLTLIERNMFL